MLRILDEGFNHDSLRAKANARTAQLRAQGLLKKPAANPAEALADKPHSMARAIKAFCYQCMGAQPGWRKDVANRTAPQCPLFNFRPGRSKAAAAPPSAPAPQPFDPDSSPPWA